MEMEMGDGNGSGANMSATILWPSWGTEKSVRFTLVRVSA